MRAGAFYFPAGFIPGFALPLRDTMPCTRIRRKHKVPKDILRERKKNQIEAQRSVLDLERRSSGMGALRRGSGRRIRIIKAGGIKEN